VVNMVNMPWFIPIDPTEAMSSYSALLFIATAIVCIFLYKQNMRLQKELVIKESQLRAHTNKEADILHKRIEKGLQSNSNDLKNVINGMSRVENTVTKLTSDMGYITKTMDEVKCTIEKIRIKK